MSSCNVRCGLFLTEPVFWVWIISIVALIAVVARRRQVKHRKAIASDQIDEGWDL